MSHRIVNPWAWHYLGTFDRLFGIPVTTRNWNTITAIARVLGNGGT